MTQPKMEGQHEANQRYDFIKIYVGKGDVKRLEPQLSAANGLDAPNRVLGTNFATDNAGADPPIGGS